MRKVSSDTVTVKYLNRDEIITQLQQCATRLKQSNKNVLHIYLFGSLVQDTYGPQSDADLLIVLAADQRRRIDRIPELQALFSQVEVGVDILPLTEKELHREIANNNDYLAQIIERGMELG